MNDKDNDRNKEINGKRVKRNYGGIMGNEKKCGERKRMMKEW